LRVSNNINDIGGIIMETRIALIGIIVENMESADTINHLLSQYGKYIVGRMGIPYRDKNVSIISVVIDATNDVISTLTGKIGMLDGVSVKAVYQKL
jgi:putative iron-only hydrogenase system regulator